MLRVALFCFVLLWATTACGQEDPMPGPEHSPQDVVRFQLEAMQSNNTPHPNAGVEVAFRFASPGNKETTGPLDRFVLMVHGEAYAPLLNHLGAEFGQALIEPDAAMIPVIITSRDGARIAYAFFLSRQSGGEYEDCWMTDSVVPVPLPDEAPGRRT